MTNTEYPVRLEVAFDADPSDPDTWTWTDLSDDLVDQTVVIKRGRADEASTPAATSVKFVLDNQTGDYTPTRRDSIHYPYIRRGVPIRFSVWYNDAWEVRFVGFAESWTPTWPHGDLSDGDYLGESFVTIDAAGPLRRLAQNSAIVLDDAASSVVAQWGEPNTVLYQGTEATVEGVKPLTWVPGALWPRVVGNVPSHTNPTVFTAWGQHYCPSIAVYGTWNALDVRTSGFVWRWLVTVTGTTISLYRTTTASGLTLVTTAPNTAPYDGVRRVALSVTQTTANQVTWRLIYTHGDQPESGNHIADVTGTISNTPCPLGRVTQVFCDSGAIEFSTASGYGNFAPTELAVTTGDMDWTGDGLGTNWAGERAGRRIERIAGLYDVPFTAVGDLDETQVLSEQKAAGPAEIILDAAKVDMGVLSEDLDGPGITYRCREYNRQPAAALDARADLLDPFVPVLDDQRYRNRVSVTPAIGGKATVSDDAAVALDGIREDSLTLAVPTTQQAREQAGWRLRLSSNEAMRYPTVTAEMSDVWLAITPGDRVTVSGLPPQHPDDDADLLIEGWTETITNTRWTIQANCSPAEPWEVGVVDDGDGPPVILCLGDSITEGLDATALENRWINVLQTLLRAGAAGGDGYIPAWRPYSFGTGLFPQPAHAGTVSGSAVSGLGYRAAGIGTGGSVTYTTDADLAEVWYGTATGGIDALDITVDGGTPIVVPTDSGVASWKDRRVFIELGAGSHTVVFARHAGGATFGPTLSGVRFYSGDGPPYRYLYCDGDGLASCPDSAALSFSNDPDVRVRVRADDLTPSVDQHFAGKWNSLSTPQRTWLFGINTAGNLFYVWSPNGTATTTVTSSAPNLTAGADVWLRVTQDLDNGAGGNDVAFWVSYDDTNDHTEVTWTQIGTTTTTAGVASLYDSTAVLSVGAIFSGAPGYFTGRVYAAAVLEAGVERASPRFDRGASTWDAQNNVWTTTSADYVTSAAQVGVTVIDAARAGSTLTLYTAGATGASTGTSDLADQVAFVNPGVVILAPFINEWQTSVSVATASANAQTVIDTILEGAPDTSLLLVAWYEPDAAYAGSIDWSDYVDEIHALATANDAEVVDFYTDGPTVDAPFGLHPSDTGHLTIATTLSQTPLLQAARVESGRLDSTSTVLDGALDDSSLVFDVTGATWDDTAEPFGIRIGLEEMTVTEVNGQTFTVTRPNPEAHDDGTAVNAYPGFVLAL